MSEIILAGTNTTPKLSGKERGGLIEMPSRPGERFTFIPFLFNPVSFEETDGSNYVKQVVPMFADPIIQYIGGSGRAIKYSIMLEYERIQELIAGRSRDARLVDQIGGVTATGIEINQRSFTFESTDSRAQAIVTGISFPRTIEGYLDAIEKLRLPKRGNKPGEIYLSSPPNVMIVFGVFYRIGVIEKVSTLYKEFFNNGQIRSAEVQVEMIINSRGRATIQKEQNKGKIAVPTAATQAAAASVTIVAPQTT